jgi:DNA-binding HxlR family transcriptional regulator
MKGLDLRGRCPVDLAIDLVGGKWKPLILYRLRDGTMRFGELQRAIPNVTQRMLTLQLRELERDGLVVRTIYAEVPPKVEYTMTGPARGLLPVMEALGRWVIANQAELGRPAAPARTARPAAPESAASRPRAS